MSEYQAAFVVFIDNEGEVGATADIETPFATDRPCSEGDMRRAMKDLLYLMEKADDVKSALLVLHLSQQPESVNKVAEALERRQNEH